MLARLRDQSRQGSNPATVGSGKDSLEDSPRNLCGDGKLCGPLSAPSRENCTRLYLLPEFSTTPGIVITLAHSSTSLLRVKILALLK